VWRHSYPPGRAVGVIVGIDIPAVRGAVWNVIMSPCMIVEMLGSSALRVTVKWAYQLSRFELYLLLFFTHGENAFEGISLRAFVYR
jgi:hypothetical protein